MDFTHYTQAIDFAMTLAGAVVVFWGYAKFIHSRVMTAFAACWGFGKALGALPGVLAGMDGVHSSLQEIKDGLLESHGMQITISGRVEVVANQLSLQASIMRADRDTDPRRAVLECGTNGLITDFNKTFLRWTGLQPNEAKNNGWLNAVHPKDRDRVREERRKARTDERTCSIRYTIVSVDGDEFEVDHTETPIPEGKSPPNGWFAVLFKVQS